MRYPQTWWPPLLGTQKLHVMFKTTQLHQITKTLSIQHSKIALKIVDPTSIRHPKSHCTMGRSSACNLSLSGKKSTTLAARQSPSKKWQEGRVGRGAKLPRAGKATSASSSTHPSTAPANSTTPIPKGDSILPPSSSHCMMRRSQRINGACLVAIFLTHCWASPTADCIGLENAAFQMTNTCFATISFVSPDETSSLYYDFSFPRLPCYPNLDIGHSLNLNTTFNEVDHRVIKESHLPAVQ